MTTRALRRRLGGSLLTASAVFLLVPLSVDLHALSTIPRPDVTRTPVVIVEPAIFVGMVEVTGDAEHGFGVLISTATEEVVVADDAVSRALMRFEGEVVAARGRLIETAEAPTTMVVREFRVLGTEPGRTQSEERLVSERGAIAC